MRIPFGFFGQHGPTEQQFPASAAAWSAAWPTVTTPTALWTFQESAFPIDDKISPSSFDLAQGAAGTFTFEYAEDPNGRLGIRALAGSSYARVPTTSDFNITTSGIVSMYCRFGSIATHGTIRRPVMGKRSRVALNAGYRVVVMPVTGYLRLEVCDGSTEVAVEIAEDHGDNGFYNVMAVVNRTSQMGRLYSSKTGASASASIAGLATLSNSIRYSFGDGNGVETDTGTVWDYGANLSGTEWTSGNFTTMSGP